MGKLRHIFLAMVLVQSAAAQSAENFDTKSLAPRAPAEKQDKAVKTAPKEAGPVSTTPSRFVGSTEKEAYLASMTAMFLIGSRERDPFGQPQDPDAKPIIKASAPQAVKRVAQIQATPFSDIVGMLVVTTIMPGEKRFLIGTRSVREGEQLPLTLRGRPIRVQVMSVTSREIGFKNLDSGETATRKLDMLPPGMTPGHDGINAPGMTPDRPNAPIELDAGNPVPEPFPKPPIDQ